MHKIKDLHLENCRPLHTFIDGLSLTGFQASKIKEAGEVIKSMHQRDCTVFLSFTANMMASGLRGVLTDLVKKGYVDVVVTTGGSIDHDIIRSYLPYLLGSFDADDTELRKKGINRIGNIYAPNDRYELLEEKIRRALSRLYKKKKTVSPSELVWEFGRMLKKKESFIHQCFRHRVPVFSPGITDSAIGLQIYFFKQDHPDFLVDVTGDMQQLADVVLSAKETGAIILGGGISKHHTLGANLVRGGLDYAVYVSTATQYDGSLSGAVPPEARSWGKLQEKARSVHVYGDASVMFPLIAAGL